jgi:hypothetical protein
MHAPITLGLQVSKVLSEKCTEATTVTKITQPRRKTAQVSQLRNRDRLEKLNNAAMPWDTAFRFVTERCPV